MRLLVIEDEPKVARALKTGVERAGYGEKVFEVEDRTFEGAPLHNRETS